MSSTETKPTLPETQPAEDWRKSLVRDAKGNPRATLNNCLIAICESGEFPFDRNWEYRLSNDVLECGYYPRGWKHLGHLLARFRSWLESHGIYASGPTMKQALLLYANGDAREFVANQKVTA